MHLFWKFILTPPANVVPAMLKIAVNNSPVAPGDVRNPLGPITAKRTVVGFSHEPHDIPEIRIPPTQFARVIEAGGIIVPVRSIPYGLSLDVSLELSVMSNPLNELVLLIMIGTLSKVFGVVRGPLKTGGVIGHAVSVTWVMQTMPPLTA